jgi:hypothetical protein
MEGLKNAKLGAEIDQMGGHKTPFEIPDFRHLIFGTYLFHGYPPCGNLKLSQKYILDRSLTKAGLFRIIPNEHQATKRSNWDQQSDMLLVWLQKNPNRTMRSIRIKICRL